MEQTNNGIVRDLAMASQSAIITAKTHDGREVEIPFIHEDMNPVNVDRFADSPRRIDERICLYNLASFIGLVNRFKSESTMITANKVGSEVEFTARIDYHTPDQPSHCEHQIILKTLKSRQWGLWEKNQKEHFSQRKFWLFIEDNIQDIIEPDSATLLSQIKSVKVSRSGKVESSVSDDRLNQSASNSQALESGAPQPLSLALKPWEYMDNPLEIKARIYTHIDNDGTVEFSYQLINAQDAIDKKFTDYKNSIESETGFVVYI